MRYTAIFPGRYVQAEGAFEQLPSELERLGGRPLVIAGGTAAEQLLPRYGWPFPVERFGGESSQEEVDRLTAAARERGADCVVGMGGGKVLDTAKAVAHAVDRPVAIVPTIASTDAPCSAVAVLYTPAGAFDRYLFLKGNPDLVLVDTAVIARAPARFLIAGMGDALSTWFEADSCRRAYAPNQCGGLGTLAAHALARLCYDTLLTCGLAALAACEAQVVTPALSHIVEANTLLSGLGFECAGLATAHSIHNGLTALPETHHFYHGEKVAFGVLAGLFLADHPPDVVSQVYGFCEQVGLPTTLAQLGLDEKADLRQVAERACAEGETIHHEACPVTPAAVEAAMRAADRVGLKRRGV